MKKFRKKFYVDVYLTRNGDGSVIGFYEFFPYTSYDFFIMREFRYKSVFKNEKICERAIKRKEKILLKNNGEKTWKYIQESNAYKKRIYNKYKKKIRKSLTDKIIEEIIFFDFLSRKYKTKITEKIWENVIINNLYNREEYEKFKKHFDKKSIKRIKTKRWSVRKAIYDKKVF